VTIVRRSLDMSVWQRHSLAILLICAASCGKADDRLTGSVSTSSRRIAADRSKVFARTVEECMRSNGFQYRATVVPQTKLVKPVLGEPIRFRTEYGVVEVLTTSQKRTRDPNEHYLSTLSETDKRAYKRALLGDGPSSQLPCAARAVKASQALSEDSRFSKLAAEFDVDPYVRRYRSKWASCMGKAGYKFNRRNQMLESLLEVYSNDLQGEVSVSDLLSREAEVVRSDRQCVSDAEEAQFQLYSARFLTQNP
jgi:hypothetical protein